MTHPEDREWSRLARLSLLRLSATSHDGRFNNEYQALTRLKTHFSLLDDENDEDTLVEVKYYTIWPSKTDLILGVPIIALLIYLFIKV